jgi:hypothetical protein
LRSLSGVLDGSNASITVPLYLDRADRAAGTTIALEVSVDCTGGRAGIAADTLVRVNLRRRTSHRWQAAGSAAGRIRGQVVVH